MANDKVEDLRKKLSGLKRKAWLPIVREQDGELTGSKFSGVPWLGRDEAWPLCPQCGELMQLFLQLNLAELPKDLGSPYGAGLLQMFFCVNNEPSTDDHDDFEPFSRCHLLRLVQPAPTRRVQAPEKIAGGYYLPVKMISGWKEIEDYPHPYECEEHGIVVEDSDYDSWDSLSPRSQSDKLAGWPIWVQGIEYPNCRQCSQRMQMVFQLNSEENLLYMFGDCGRGHITQCPTHKDELAFGWACT